jgi:hypothetical protein
MSVKINLADKTTPIESRSVKAKKLRAVSFIVLSLTAFLAIIIFALQYRLSASYVKKEEADQLKALEPYTNNSAKIFIINSKLSGISEIISTRKNYNSIISRISSASSQGVNIDNFTMNSQGITMAVSSNTLSPLDNFLNALINLTKDQTISSVVLKNLTFDSGKYVVDLSMK